MKPASFQSVASTVMNPNISLGHLLSTPNLMRCEKCRFTTTDISVFKKHVAQEHTEYYCFYCNQVSLSEAELQTHLQIHTGTSPFKCPHCGQVYMRRMCLIKHIDRLHSKIVPHAPPKIMPHVSASSAPQSVSSATDSLSQRPVVRVNVPTPSTAGLKLDTNLQRLKSLSSYYSNASHSDGVPSNGHFQRNRALTVSLPEEVSIPAGCMVEVAEVKTVDGTKELRLRFVAQENESVTKNGRTTVPETSKLLSQIKCPNAESGMQMVNKNHVNRERPTLVQVNTSKSFPNQMKEQRLSAKRSSDVIDLDAGVPSKIPRSFNSLNEAKVAAQKEPINHSSTPTAMSSMLANRLTTGTLLPENLSTGISLKAIEERNSCAPGPPSSLESIMLNYMQIMPHIVSMNHSSATVKAKEDSSLQKNKHDLTNSQEPNLKARLLPLKPPMVALPQVRVTNECKDNFVSKTFVPEQGSSQKASVEPVPARNQTHTSNTLLKTPALPQEVKTEKSSTEDVRVEREGFPVISSVYSLSHQPSVPQESTQPIVMAEWTNSAGCDSLKIKSVRTEHSKITSGHQAHTDSKETNLSLDTLSNKVSDSVKIEEDQYIQDKASAMPHNIHSKKDKRTPAKANKKSKITKTCSAPMLVNKALSVNRTLPPQELVQVNRNLSPQELVQVNRNLSPQELVQVNRNLSPQELVQVNRTLSPHELVQVNRTLSPHELVQANRTLSPHELVQANRTLSPHELVQANRTLSPHELVQVNRTLSPHELVQANRTLSPHELVQANRTLSPHELVQANRTLSPHELVQANRTLPPHELVQANRTLSPHELVQANRTLPPHELVQVNRTSSPIERVQGDRTLAPTEHVQVNKTLAPTKHVQVNKVWASPAHVNKTLTPTEHVHVNKTLEPTENVQVNQTLAPPAHVQVNKTWPSPERVQVNHTLAPPKHVKVKKNLASPKKVKVRKTLASPKHVKVNKTWAPPLQPVFPSPLIPQPTMDIDNILVQKPVAAHLIPKSPSKILTVSLKRVQVGISGKGKKKGKTVFKLRLPKPLGCSKDFAALQLMPLRKNQAVKLPSPNQPVVVLNHPKPRANMELVLANTPRNQEVTPKCHILKMKLGKVVGQRYEVMGCTLRNFS